MPSISCCRSASNYLQSSETWSGQLSVKLETLRSGNMVLGNFYIGYNVHFPEYFESTNGHP